MAVLFEKILCPVDFDLNSASALNLASRLIEQYGGVIYVLNVIPTPKSPLRSDAYPVLSEGLSDQLEKFARESLQRKTSFQPLVRVGDPAETILEVANELGVDVIVMATHGHTGVKRLLLGTVAERVVREAKQPVITICRQS